MKGQNLISIICPISDSNATHFSSNYSLSNQEVGCNWSKSKLEINVIIYFVTTSLALMVFLFLMTFISALRMERKLSSGKLVTIIKISSENIIKSDML